MASIITFRWCSLAVLLLVSIWCSTGAAQQWPANVTSGPALAQAVMDQMEQFKPLTTCRLTLVGGSNITEMDVYGTTIARAELACTGRKLQIAVHPALARFVKNFTGVQVAKIPDIENLELTEQTALQLLATNTSSSSCFSRTGMLMFLCGQPSVEFLQPHIANMRSRWFEALRRGLDEEQTFDTLVVGGKKGVVSVVKPFISQCQFTVFSSGESLLHVKGGWFNATMGILSGSMVLLNGTRFTHNEGFVFGGAVTILAGVGVFRDCVFEANRAKTVADTTGGVASVEVLRSGGGGAVLVYLIQSSRGNTTEEMQTSAVFVNCTFADNKAYEGGAIAMVGGNASITNCTFTGNSAIRSGMDVFSSRGGALDIVDSSISVASETVTWERLDRSECMRGEFYGKLEGTCRRCTGATYSLATPVPASCNVCPANAKCTGGDAIVAANGFFRVSNVSDKVIGCPRAAACLEDKCAEVHEGVVCGSCSEGYAPAMPFKCAKCASKGGGIVVFVVSTLILIMFAGVGVQLTLTANREEAVESAADPTAGDVVKLLALFLQYTSIIGSLPVPWPAPLLALITASDWVFAASVGQTLAWVKSPFECALKGLRAPPAMLKQLIYLLMPAFVAVVLLLLFVGIYSCCCRKKRHTLRLTVVLLVSAFFTFPVVLRAAFSFFGCFMVEDPSLRYSLWWVQAMSQPCYRGAHRVWSFAVGLPFLIACCSAPLVLSLWLWRNSARMGEPDFRERFAHLYRLYRAHAYWYEPVILIQTILLVALAAFASQIGNYAAVLLTGLHIAMALQLLQLVRPYAAQMLHRLHVASLCCLLLNLFVALLMFDQSPATSGAMGIAQAAAAAFSLIMSVCFIIASCACICIFLFRGPGKLHLSSLLARWCGGSSSHTHGRRRRMTT